MKTVEQDPIAHWGDEQTYLWWELPVSQTESLHRREVARIRRANHKRRLAILSLPALAGLAVMWHEVTSWNPVPALIVVGIVLVLPFLTELTSER